MAGIIRYLVQPCQVVGRSWAQHTLDSDVNTPFTHVPKPAIARSRHVSFEGPRVPGPAALVNGLVVVEVDPIAAVWMMSGRCSNAFFADSLRWCWMPNMRECSKHSLLHRTLAKVNQLGENHVTALRAAAERLSSDLKDGIFVFFLRDNVAAHVCANGSVFRMHLSLAFLAFMATSECVGFVSLPHYLWPLEKPNILVTPAPISPQMVADSVMEMTCSSEPDVE